MTPNHTGRRQMENRSFSEDRFRLGEFLASFTTFYRWWSETNEDGGVGVSLLKRMGDSPVPSDEERNLEVELNSGMLVFFPFHEPITDVAIKCLDGSVLEDDPDDPLIDLGFEAGRAGGGARTIQPYQHQCSGHSVR